MATFYLVRHGTTDYSERNKKIYQGFGVNLSPLSPEGVKEIEITAKDRAWLEQALFYPHPIQEPCKLRRFFQKNFRSIS